MPHTKHCFILVAQDKFIYRKLKDLRMHFNIRSLLINIYNTYLSKYFKANNLIFKTIYHIQQPFLFYNDHRKPGEVN